jgi:hypothetical protein
LSSPRDAPAFSKRKADKTLALSGIRGNNVVLAYTSEAWDEPCAGKTLMVKYPQADGSGCAARTRDEQDGGIPGGEYVQAAHDVTELVVSANLLFVIKDVL